jgi:hypothetical protein
LQKQKTTNTPLHLASSDLPDRVLKLWYVGMGLPLMRDRLGKRGNDVLVRLGNLIVEFVAMATRNGPMRAS